MDSFNSIPGSIVLDEAFEKEVEQYMTNHTDVYQLRQKLNVEISHCLDRNMRPCDIIPLIQKYHPEENLTSAAIESRIRRVKQQRVI